MFGPGSDIIAARNTGEEVQVGNRLVMLAAAAAVVLAGCASSSSSSSSATSPAATPTPSPSPLAIGDPCVIGRWTQTTSQVPNTTTFPGATLQITGGAGAVFTLTADGSETADFSNSAMYVGSGGGHTLRYQLRGTDQYTLHADAGKWAENGSGQSIMTIKYVLDGVAQPDGVGPAPPSSNTYTCTSSQLTLVGIPPYPGTVTYTK